MLYKRLNSTMNPLNLEDVPQSPELFVANNARNENKTITIKSVVVGLIIGILLCFTNMYFGLQSGWISMMSLQSSLLGYAISKHFIPLLLYKTSVKDSNFSINENVFIQTVSTAVATLPLAGGFVGIIPAIELHLNTQLTFSKMFIWSTGVSFFGIFIALILRKQTIIKEKLEFPSGTATAQMISLLHNKEEKHIATDVENNEPTTTQETEKMSKQWTALIMSFLVSSIFAILKAVFPEHLKLPLPFSEYGWYIDPAFSYVGQGMIMGLPTTLSMLLGAIVGWGILAPLSKQQGWAPGEILDWKEGPRGWILWISLAIMITESFVSLTFITMSELKTQLSRIYVFVGKAENSTPFDEPDVSTKSHSTDKAAVGLLICSILCVFCVCYAFPQISVFPTIIALIASFVLSILAVRALGETDLNPVSGIGKVTQILFSYVLPNNIVGNLLAGGISEAGAQQAGDLMQDFKTGYMLETPPRAQFFGQILGTIISVFVSVLAYILFKNVYDVPSATFPIPTAYIWLDMAVITNEGNALPKNSLQFCIAFGLLFLVTTTLKTLFKNFKFSKFIPSGIAFAIGIYNTPNFTIPRVIGALFCHFYLISLFSRIKSFVLNESTQSDTQKKSQYQKILTIVTASGFVLGEGTMAIALLLAKSVSKR